MAANKPRYEVRKDRAGWTVVDTRTGAVEGTGMVGVGARQLADHLNAGSR